MKLPGQKYICHACLQVLSGRGIILDATEYIECEGLPKCTNRAVVRMPDQDLFLRRRDYCQALISNSSHPAQ